MRRIAIIFAVSVSYLVSAATDAVSAVDLTRLPRRIGKEPAYRSAAPRYCLLVFGPQARTRVWLVLDGAAMYVDRNANGDLTEAGECVRSNSRSFELGNITELDGRTTHERLRVTVYDDQRFRMAAYLSGGCRQTVGYGRREYVRPRFAARPQDAPVIHFNGPVTFARYGPVTFLPRRTSGHSLRRTWLRLLVGTPGLGEGTFAGYSCSALRCNGRYQKPLAEIEFPHREPRSAPLKLRQSLEVKG